MKRIHPVAMIALVASLSACSTVSRVGDVLWPFGDGDDKKTVEEKAAEEGRVSILTFEQKLVADSTLAGKTPSVPPPVDFADWSQPGGTPDNAPPPIAGAADLSVAWKQGAGEGSSNKEHIGAVPVIAGGKIFFLDAAQNVIALDAQSGKRVWDKSVRPKKSVDRIATGGGVAFGDGRVYVTSGYGSVIALSADTGDELWRIATPAPFNAAPTFAQGRVFAVTNDSELMAMDAATGQVQWTHQAIAEPARILSAPSPAVHGDTVIAPFASGEVVALLAANGRRLWVDALTRAGRLTSLSAINDIAGRPVASEGIVFAVSHSGVLAAIDERTGQRIWARGTASTQTPWVAGDTLYIVTVDGELAALDKLTGNAFWVKQLRRYKDEKDKKGRIAWTGPIMIGGNLLLASSEGQAVLVSPATGEITKEIKLGDPVFIPPVAAGGTAYLVTDAAKIIALR